MVVGGGVKDNFDHFRLLNMKMVSRLLLEILRLFPPFFFFVLASLHVNCSLFAKRKLHTGKCEQAGITDTSC